MTAAQLAHLLAQCDPNAEVFIGPNVEPLDWVEELGRELRDPYVVLHHMKDA